MKKVAIITGAAGGLGAVIAKAFSREGFMVGIVDIKDGSDVVKEIETEGGSARFFSCDITRSDEVETLKNSVEEVFGRCDVLINNAGRYEFTPTDSVTFETWRKMMSLNLDGMFMMTQAILPLMKKNQWGRIICIASNSCFEVPAGLTGYVASKSAVIGYVKSLSGEVGADGITVNVIAPGPIVTDQLRSPFGDDPDNQFDHMMNSFVEQQAVKLIGTPELVVPAILFFASEGAAYITGQTLVVDGGLAKH